MKATEIRMQIVKNIGNYETVRMEAVYDIKDETRPIEMLFADAKQRLDNSFVSMYHRESEKLVLSLDTPGIERIKDALKTGRTTFNELTQHYIISDSVSRYLNN